MTPYTDIEVTDKYIIREFNDKIISTTKLPKKYLKQTLKNKYGYGD